MVERWRSSETDTKVKKKSREIECRRAEDRIVAAGGSPQATSDIRLCDGLMRLA